MTDNSMTNNSMTDNSMTNNSMTDNSMTNNSMTDNSMTNNSMTDNSMTDNSMTDNLIKQVENISLDQSQCQFYVENTYDPDKKFFIMKISLNFYQLWSILGQIPFIHKNGRCKYEWIIRQGNSNRIFSIYDWNNKNKLLNTTQWYIRSNMPGDSSEFLKTLSDAIECYNLYYKHQMENNLHDTLPELETDIHFFQILHEIKHNFIKHFSLLQTL